MLLEEEEDEAEDKDKDKDEAEDKDKVYTLEEGTEEVDGGFTSRKNPRLKLG